MSDVAAPVRLIRRISGLMGDDGLRTEMCRVFPDVERQLRTELNNDLGDRDYAAADRHIGELHLMQRLQAELCKRVRVSPKIETRELTAHKRRR
jgi:hypothetical protein